MLNGLINEQMNLEIKYVKWIDEWTDEFRNKVG